MEDKDKCIIYANCGRDCTRCAAKEAKEKARKMKPRETTIFEGEDAEKLAAKGFKNYKTYKCPVCNWIVADSSVLGIRISNFCENCGQALDSGKNKKLERVIQKIKNYGKWGKKYAETYHHDQHR